MVIKDKSSSHKGKSGGKKEVSNMLGLIGEVSLFAGVNKNS